MPAVLKVNVVTKTIQIPAIEYAELKLASRLAGQTFSAFAVSAMQDRARAVRDKIKKQEDLKNAAEAD